jgi:hypothetical protein
VSDEFAPPTGFGHNSDDGKYVCIWSGNFSDPIGIWVENDEDDPDYRINIGPDAFVHLPQTTPAAFVQRFGEVCQSAIYMLEQYGDQEVGTVLAEELPPGAINFNKDKE